MKKNNTGYKDEIYSCVWMTSVQKGVFLFATMHLTLHNPSTVVMETHTSKWTPRGMLRCCTSWRIKEPLQLCHLVFTFDVVSANQTRFFSFSLGCFPSSLNIHSVWLVAVHAARCRPLVGDASMARLGTQRFNWSGSKRREEWGVIMRGNLRLLCNGKVWRMCRGWGGGGGRRRTEGASPAKVICCLATVAEHPTVSFAEIFCFWCWR